MDRRREGHRTCPREGSSLPRYHFNVHDGAGRLDEEGVDLPDRASARLEAVRLTGAIFRDDPTALIAEGGCWLEVTNAGGTILLAIHVMVVENESAVGQL